jgi:hypothetical protein
MKNTILALWLSAWLATGVNAQNNDEFDIELFTEKVTTDIAYVICNDSIKNLEPLKLTNIWYDYWIIDAAVSSFDFWIKNYNFDYDSITKKRKNREIFWTEHVITLSNKYLEEINEKLTKLFKLPTQCQWIEEKAIDLWIIEQ